MWSGITRRHFAATLAGTLAALRTASAAPRLKIGVGTFSYHSLSTDDMITQLKKNGVTEIEMSRDEFMLMKPPSEQMCQEVRQKLDATGIRCVSYYTATIKDDKDIDYAIRFGKILGAANISGDATGDTLKAVDHRFGEAGLTFGIHNHWFPQKFPYESAEDVLAALKGLSNTVGSTLDVGQMAACGHNPVEAVKMLAPHLKLVHLKDVQGAGAEHNVLLGQGVADIPGVMRELKKLHFSRLVAIEFEKGGDVNQDMEEELKYARNLA